MEGKHSTSPLVRHWEKVKTVVLRILIGLRQSWNQTYNNACKLAGGKSFGTVANGSPHLNRGLKCLQLLFSLLFFCIRLLTLTDRDLLEKHVLKSISFDVLQVCVSMYVIQLVHSCVRVCMCVSVLTWLCVCVICRLWVW